MSTLRRSGRFVARYAFSLVSTAYLFTFGIRSRRHRGLLTQIARHFGFDNTVGEATVPQVTLADATDESLPIVVREPVARDGNVSTVELVAIARLVRAQAPSALFEIGTFDGRTTLTMAANAPADARVYTLDLPAAQARRTALPVDHNDVGYIEKAGSGARFIGSEHAERIVQLFGDSARFDFAPYVGSIDFVFVDGAHSYEYVRSDSLVAMSLLGPRGGVIVWHDYGSWDGVTRALDELRATHASFADLRWIDGTTLAYLRRHAATGAP